MTKLSRRLFGQLATIAPIAPLFPAESISPISSSAIPQGGSGWAEDFPSPGAVVMKSMTNIEMLAAFEAIKAAGIDISSSVPEYQQDNSYFYFKSVSPIMKNVLNKRKFEKMNLIDYRIRALKRTIARDAKISILPTFLQNFFHREF